MSAPRTASAPAQDRATRPSPFTYSPPARSAPAEPVLRRCKYCCTDIPPQAKKCFACGEWIVGTSRGFAAGVLRLLGWAWALVSCASAAVILYVGDAIRQQLVFHDAAEYLTPF